MKFAVLASSSAGNSVYVESGGTRLLVDAGLNCKRLAAALSAAAGEPLERIDAVLLTHEHSDHVSSLRVLERRHRTPLYATDGTFAGCELDKACGGCAGWNANCVEPGVPFAVGAFEILPFRVPHDASDPVGYVVSDGAARLGIATDLGVATPAVADALRGCGALLLEFNHDALMLERSSRPPALVQRIRGRSGHLSNDQAAELLASVAGPGLRHAVPMHPSAECNRPELAVAAARDALRAAGLDPGLVHAPAFPTPLFEV